MAGTFANVLPRIGQWLWPGIVKSAYNYLPESVGQFPQGEQLTGIDDRGGTNRRALVPRADLWASRRLYVGTKARIRSNNRQLTTGN